MSDCSICAAGGACNYSSVASNNVVVEHVFCGKSQGAFWCCPTVRDGKETQCASRFGQCDYVNQNSPLLTVISATLPLLLICCLISACFSWRRRRNQQAAVAAMGNQQGQLAYGQPPYGQPVYGQPVNNNNNNNGRSNGGALAAGAAGGLLGGMLLGGAFDGGGGDGGDFAGDMGVSLTRWEPNLTRWESSLTRVAMSTQRRRETPAEAERSVHSHSANIMSGIECHYSKSPVASQKK
eukprot:CAMPEP_0117069040 /NCGR_PEP_ID=MMETSP0472-20121206/48387_1 /TAXON_ID=693140 ORGANISM="Tiarina fusus, Strain LIS" /NCGR_SAMPLE_ID=MMETSP0472 /ASSEMBLY_ACC=CAM_ASM_000603 /LENGTH=237 /DNA_ID=CAMNT_0004791345 /DNA_START=73 /DNA_END=784 /DNA_ORIENTATION=+